MTVPHHGEQAIPGQGAVAATPFVEPVRLAEVDSTNRYAADAARAGAPEGLVVLADLQTAGRGRRGRRWSAPAASAVLCSFLFRPRLDAGDLHLLPTLVGLAARRACLGAASGLDISLKWPNDLLVGERKLAGILSEVVPGAPAAELGPAVVVGVGINVTWPAAGGGGEVGEVGEGFDIQTATSLAAESDGRQVDREAVATELVAAVNALYGGLFAGAAGRPSRRACMRLMSEYRSACSTIGSRVRVELIDEKFEGTALDVTDEGTLLVATRACVRTVDAGDVVHVRQGAAPS